MKQSRSEPLTKSTRNLPIYLLSAALVISSVIYSDKASSAPKYVTTQQYKSDLKVLAAEIVKLQKRVGELESCVSETTQSLTQRVPVTFWCP